MTDLDKVTYVLIEIENGDEEGFGVGIELGRRDANKSFKPYAIMSLFIPKSKEFPSKRQVFFHCYAEVFKLIPDTDELVIFKSISPYFTKQRKEHARKASVFAGGREVLFRQHSRAPIPTRLLSQDSLKPERRNSIIERLI